MEKEFDLRTCLEELGYSNKVFPILDCYNIKSKDDVLNLEIDEESEGNTVIIDGDHYKVLAPEEIEEEIEGTISDMLSDINNRTYYLYDELLEAIIDRDKIKKLTIADIYPGFLEIDGFIVVEC